MNIIKLGIKKYRYFNLIFIALNETVIFKMKLYSSYDFTSFLILHCL